MRDGSNRKRDTTHNVHKYIHAVPYIKLSLCLFSKTTQMSTWAADSTASALN